MNNVGLQTAFAFLAFAALFAGNALVTARYRRRTGERHRLKFDLSEQVSLSNMPLLHYDKIEWLILLATAVLFLSLAFVAAAIG